MKINPTGSTTPSFCGLRRLVYKSMATNWEKELFSLKDSASQADKFIKTEKKPIEKIVTRTLNSRNQVIGIENKFQNGSYCGIRVFPDGTIFDYRTYKYEDRLFGEKMGVRVHIINKKGHNYTVSQPEAYRENGTPNLPSVKKINEYTKKSYKEFMTKHYPALKDYLIDDLIQI